MKNRVSKVWSICLYVLAGIMLVYSIWSFTHNVGYIGEMINSGQLTFAGNEYDILNFYMTNSVQYLVFAVLMAAAGYLIASSSTPRQAQGKAHAQAQSNADDAELDEWFEDTKPSEESKEK